MLIGHQLVAQLVVGRVQAQGQGDRDALVGELVDARHQADGRDGDAARGHAEAAWGRVGQAAYGAHHGLVVGQRLAHPHEDDVGDASGPARDLAAGQRPGAGDDLLDDLGGGHVALEAALAGGAERAGHPAAGLARDAHGDAVGVAHQHGLDQRAVEEAPQGLAGGAAVGLEGAQRRHQVGQQRGDQLVALAGGQVGHLGGVVDQPGEVVVRQLLGAEAGQSHLLQQRLAPGLVEVGEVPRRLGTAARGAHHERELALGLILGHHRRVSRLGSRVPNASVA